MIRWFDMAMPALFAPAVALTLLLAGSTHARESQGAEHKSYPLTKWQGRCSGKGRFQDPEYCRSNVIDLVLADRAQAIPVLISQITDERLVEQPVLDYWPRVRAGELSVMVLEDLLLDETWNRRTMPDLFPDRRCDAAVPAAECWARFRKKHSLSEIQARWLAFWKVNERRILWDDRARCFRMSSAEGDPVK